MSKYYIDYGTGAGNEVVEGSIGDAQERADTGACYTQCSITIYEVDEQAKLLMPIYQRDWCGVAFDEEQAELYEDGENADVLDYGDFGYYAPWQDISDWHKECLSIGILGDEDDLEM